MRKVMIEELEGRFVVTCFVDGLYDHEMEFESEKPAEYYAALYMASNWRRSNAPSSLAIN
jgi:hypothetical protein